MVNQRVGPNLDVCWCATFSCSSDWHPLVLLPVPSHIHCRCFTLPSPPPLPTRSFLDNKDYFASHTAQKSQPQRKRPENCVGVLLLMEVNDTPTHTHTRMRRQLHTYTHTNIHIHISGTESRQGPSPSLPQRAAEMRLFIRLLRPPAQPPAAPLITLPRADRQ